MKRLSLWPLVLSLFLFGCAVQERKSGDSTAPPTNQMDTTLGSYGQGRESRLILVTMVSAAHTLLVNDQPITSADNESAELPEAYGTFLQRLQNRYGVTRVADWPLATIGIHCLVFESDGRQSVPEIIELLAREKNVETAQAMQLHDVQQQSKYNDPFVPLQHGFASMQTQQSHQWARGDGIRIAVVDTGVDLTHADLKGKTTLSRNFVDTDEQTFLADIHGTAIAGVIAAAADNDTGMVGIAPDSSLLALKACWQLEEGSSEASCNTYTLAKALNFSIDNQAHVINLSLAGPRDPLLERLVNAALDRNIIVVGAVGPGGINQFPTAVPGTIAVVTGDTPMENTVSAPGRNILSTQPENGYEFFSGSSFSTAHIAGLAALVREINSSWSPAEVLSLLEQNTDPISGSANACRTLASLNDPASLHCSEP